MDIYEPIYIKKLLDESWIVSTLMDNPPSLKPRLADCNQLAFLIKESIACDIEARSIQNLYKLYPQNGNGSANSLNGKKNHSSDFGRNRTKEVLAAYVLMQRGVIQEVQTKKNPKTKKHKPKGEYYLKFARFVQGEKNVSISMPFFQDQESQNYVPQKTQDQTLKLKTQFKKMLKVRIRAFSTLSKLIEEYDVDSFDQVERMITHSEAEDKNKKDFERIKEVFDFFMRLSTYYKSGMLDEKKIVEEDLFELEDWFHSIIDHLFPVALGSKWARLETKLTNLKPLVPPKPVFIPSSARYPVSRYHIPFFQAIDDLNQLLWNLDINYPSLLVEKNLLSTSYTFLSLNYRLASFFAWLYRVDDELVMMPLPPQSENTLYFKRYLRALKSWVCMGKEFMMTQTDQLRLIGDNMDSLLRNMIDGTAEAMFEGEKLISFPRFQAKFFQKDTPAEEFEKINYLCKFINGISPLENRYRWALLHGLHLLLIIFVNAYGKDLPKTPMVDIHDLIAKYASNGSLYPNLEKGIRQFRLDEDAFMRRLLVTLKDSTP